MSGGKKYGVKFDFTRDRQEDLLERVWPVNLAKRIIKAELLIEPCTENAGGDIRYETDDPEQFAELLKIASAHSAGGWWWAKPMPDDISVFHFPIRGGKYDNE